MNLYLDDDSCATTLVELLVKDGHEVIVPSNAQIGQHDALHLLAAAEQEHCIVTRNYKDFHALHQLVIGTGGNHFGIVLIRTDNDRIRDMKTRTIVAAIGKLHRAIEDGYQEIEDQLFILNDWR
jgi:predicted nuclease of predicted toxin-antitoxin system